MVETSGNKSEQKSKHSSGDPQQTGNEPMLSNYLLLKNSWRTGLSLAR